MNLDSDRARLTLGCVVCAALGIVYGALLEAIAQSSNAWSAGRLVFFLAAFMGWITAAIAERLQTATSRVLMGPVAIGAITATATVLWRTGGWSLNPIDPRWFFLILAGTVYLSAASVHFWAESSW
ncbi:MAG: hypothetical protein U1D55_11490 [Phycisphaerae bacterium]